MPEETQKNPDLSTSASAEPEDILSEVEVSPPVIEPKSKETKTVIEPKKIRPKFNFRILILPLVILILIGLIYGGYILTKSLFRKPTREGVNETIPVAEEKPITPLTQITPVVDTDGDGLSDSEELSFGTNPNKSDTDSDGLFDKEEIKIYQTDPLNPDTDRDGVLDGIEIKKGDDPKDPTPGARLLKLEEAINNF